jgi:hypothetical protein
MLSPFLAVELKDRTRHKSVDVDHALLGLLKAMSEIKSSPSNNHVDFAGVSQETDDVKLVDVTKEEESLRATEPDFSAAAGSKVKRERKNSSIHRKKTSVNIEIQQAMQSRRVGDVIKTLEQSMDPSNEQLNDNMFCRAIHHLSFLDLHATFKALKYFVDRLHGQGKIVKLDVYRRVILGIQYTNIRGQELRDLIHDIHRHIRPSPRGVQ